MMTGQLLIVQVPQPMPPEYLGWDLGWRQWITKVHGKMVRLDRHSGISNESGWHVQVLDPQGIPNYGTHWIPSGWFATKDVPIFKGLCDTCGGINLHENGCTTAVT